jgi:hypothetical protein
MDPLGMLAAAKRCSAVYTEDLATVTSAFSQLGMSVLGQYKNNTHQAILSKNAQGWFYLSIAGTRFGEEDNVDIIDDLWLAPVELAGAGQVASGVYSGMDDFWKWVLAQLPANATLNIEGHSLGAERALLTPHFLPPVQLGDLYAFEAPQCATQAYWDAYRSALSGAISTVCGEDIWYNWPPNQDYVHDAQSTVIWLQATGASIIKPSDWPVGLSTTDHDIQTVIAYIQAAIANGTFPH